MNQLDKKYSFSGLVGISLQGDLLQEDACITSTNVVKRVKTVAPEE